MPDSYPNGPAMADCAEDAAVSAILSHINSFYESEGTLAQILSHIFRDLHTDPVIDFDQDASEEDEAEAMAVEDGEDAEADDEQNASEDDDDEDYGDMAERDDDEFTKLVGQMRSRWERCETAARGEEQPAFNDSPPDEALSDAQPNLTSEEAKASGRQIFSPVEAYKMLANELLQIFSERSSAAVSAVEDSVYHWEVKMSAFQPGSKLARDLAQLQDRGLEAGVHLRLKYKRGLHPFFPPAVQLISPRFKGPLLGALCSHPMVQLQFWDPWLEARELLQHIKSFLQAAGQIDLEHASSSGLCSAYSPIEHALGRLEALCNVPAACRAEPAHAQLYNLREGTVDSNRLAALASSGPSSKRAKTEDQKAEKAWAKGVGYGHGLSSAEVWNSKKAEAAQAAQDADIQRIFLQLEADLQALLAEGKASADRAEEAASVVASLEASCLLPFLEQELSSASFNDMAKRAQYYSALLSVLEQLCLPSTQHLLQPIAQPSGGQSRGLQYYLQQLSPHAQRFLTILAAGSDVAAAFAPQKNILRRLLGSRSSPSCTHSGSSGGSEPAEAGKQEEASEEEIAKALAQHLVQVAAKAQRACTQAGAGVRGGRETRRSAAQRTAAAAALSPDESYIADMKPLQLDESPQVRERHHYLQQSRGESANPRERIVRCGKEIAGLASDLPCNACSSIFACIDSEHVTLWRALITGPEDTPYEGGCFIFDIYFPPTYPTVPPQVNLQTTGGGTVRFNPNLYDCGKVCLSLLGTWRGAKGEAWDSAASSALQVLVSIQSLILVEDPYFNEPGFESSMHEETSRKASAKYDLNIREQTLHWAIWQQLKSPPPEFEGVIKSHFRLRKDKIKSTCKRWVEEASAHNSAVAKRMQDYLDKFLALANAL